MWSIRNSLDGLQNSFPYSNPVVHIMAEAIEIDGETSCDEKTLENKPYEEKVFYGEMLLKFLKTETQKKSYMTTTFFGGKKGMKKRLTLIADKTARRKGSIAMAVVMIITVMLSISVAAMNNEYFESVFEGDTSYLADFVKTEKKSVSDERFTLTLEQYLVAKGQLMVVYSFEAKTEDALEELRAVDENGHSTFWDIDTLNLAPTDIDKASCHGYGGYGNSDITKFNTANKIYGILVCDSVENDEQVDFYLSTNKIKGNPKITIPMDYNMETKTVEFDDMIVEYNPISISVKYPFSDNEDDCDECEWNGTYFYFRMENGELKTFNQLYELSGGNSTFDENDNAVSWTAHAWSRKIIKPDEIKSIIVNGIEYPIDNPSSHIPIDIDSHLKPFIINSYVRQHLWLPLRELCDGLGAEIEWDGDTQSAKVEYRGSEYIFTVGSNSFFKDGDECTFYAEAPFIDENDRLIIPPTVDNYMGIDYHGYNSWVENGNLNPNAKYHVIP